MLVMDSRIRTPSEEPENDESYPGEPDALAEEFRISHYRTFSV
jgi:hypothetical protein